MSRRSAAPRRGFTMVELLVVVAIIAILVSITAVVVVKVKTKANIAKATAEIAQISNAIGAYKAKMNVAFIPAGGGGPNGGFRLCSSYVDNTGAPLPWAEVVYLKQVFPAMRLDDNGLRVGGAPVANGVATAPAGSVPLIELDNNQTLVFFLTGGPPTGLQGFSTNRQQPFETTATNRIGPFLDFPPSKYAGGAAAVSAFHASANASTNADGAASLLDPWGSPYAYFAFNPMANSYMSTAFTFRGKAVSPYIAAGKAMNQRGFQIVSAGENGQEDVAPFGFGGGGAWSPGSGDYAESGPGFDDLSNFHEGKLGVQ